LCKVKPGASVDTPGFLVGMYLGGCFVERPMVALFAMTDESTNQLTNQLTNQPTYKSSAIAIFSCSAACAAASRAMGTRKGEQLT